MFELFVYVVAVLFVLVFVAQSPKEREYERTIAQLWEECSQDDGSWFDEIQYMEIVDRALEGVEEAPAVFELADRLEVLHIGFNQLQSPVQWEQVSDKQVRALCALEGIKCNKRGRVAQVHIQRLMQVS